MKKKLSVFVLVVASALFLSMFSSCMALIPEEDEDYDIGYYLDDAWAYLYADYNPYTEKYVHIQHDSDWSEWGPYGYDWDPTESDSQTNPWTRSLVWVSYEGQWLEDGDAFVEFIA
jgi:hypothetical protein